MAGHNFSVARRVELAIYVQSVSFECITNPSQYFMQLGRNRCDSFPVLSALEMAGPGEFPAEKKRKETVCGRNSIDVC